MNPNGQYLVVIDAGHGERPQGATTVDGYYQVNGKRYYTSGTAGTYGGRTYNEYECNKQVADRVAQILAQNSKISVMRVGYTDDTPTVPNSDRVPMAKEAGASLYVSVHFNSVDNSSTNGTWTFITRGDEGSREFAEILSESISSSLGTVNRGVSANSTWAIIKSSSDTGFPGVIAEGLFMSNQSDMEKLVNGGIEKYAQGIANGVLRYLGL